VLHNSGKEKGLERLRPVLLQRSPRQNGVTFLPFQRKDIEVEDKRSVEIGQIGALSAKLGGIGKLRELRKKWVT
jgi:hypothetical protein